MNNGSSEVESDIDMDIEGDFLYFILMSVAYHSVLTTPRMSIKTTGI